MEVRQLEAFVQAAYQRSFSKAGEALLLAQPSVTARIRDLERELGERLFERTGRGVRLTEAGEAFLPYAERALGNLKEGKVHLNGMKSVSLGKLDVGSARTIGTYTLPKIIKAFRSRYPGVDVIIKTGRSQDVLEMVLSGEAQLGFTRALVHPGIECVPIMDVDIIPVVSPSHPFAAAGEASIYAVGREPLILYDRGSFYWIAINNACREVGIVPNVVMELDSIEATKRMIEIGLGISFLPRIALDNELRLKTLVDLRIIEGIEVKLQTSLIYRKGQNMGHLALAFMGVVQELFGVRFMS